MAKSVKVGVVGCGGIGLYHIRGYQACPRAEVVALCDASPKRLSAAAGEFKIDRTYADWREIVSDPEIDVISVALPNCLHAPVSIAALKAGRHTFCDKPPATSAAEMERMIAAAGRARKKLMIGQDWRFQPDTQKVKHHIDRGDLGTLYHGHAYVLRRLGIPNLGSWFTQKKLAGGGCLYDIGVHFLDLVLHLCGAFKPISVSGMTYTKYGQRGIGKGGWGMSEVDRKAPFDVDDYACGLIRFDGLTILLEASWALPMPVEGRHGVDLYGTQGGAHLFPAQITRLVGGKFVTGEPKLKKLPLTTDRFTHFVDCVLDGREMVVKPEQSLVVQRILDAIYRSADSGREVTLARH